jgi:methylmalonyl-CoA mutase
VTTQPFAAPLTGSPRPPKSGGNLLAASIAAIRTRATVGEVSDAMEKVFGRFVATTQCISGVYASEYSDNAVIDAIRKRTADFMEKEGRRPRILLTKMGQDGHDRGVKVVATAFADLGFDVDISPMFQTPEEAAKMAVENDVHLVGASSLAAGHKALVPQLIQALKKAGGEDILVIVGGVIPPGDYDFLYQAGAVGVFGPGTAITDSANKVLNALDNRKS